MRAIERAMAHYQRLGTLSMEVAEWGEGDAPLTVYWTPVTLEERVRLFKDGGVNLASYVDVVVMKALGVDGKPLFTLEDKPRLRRAVASDVIIRIGMKMLAAPSVEEAEKN